MIGFKFTDDPTLTTQAAVKASAEGHVSEYTGRSLSVEMQRHLLGDSVIGPLGELTGDVYELLEDAEDCRTTTNRPRS